MSQSRWFFGGNQALHAMAGRPKCVCVPLTDESPMRAGPSPAPPALQAFQITVWQASTEATASSTSDRHLLRTVPQAIKHHILAGTLCLLPGAFVQLLFKALRSPQNGGLV